MPFKFTRLSGLPEVVLVEPAAFADGRGFFMETYKYSEFARAGIKERFVQDNHSRSSKNVLRGLHYQKNPSAQGKLVRCVSGRIFDAAVDIRRGSPTYGKWAGVELSGENHRMLFIPAGFAHGFLALSETADVLYKCTAEYSPEDDRGIIWNDPSISIDWPVREPAVSPKDSGHPGLEGADNNFVYASER